MTDEPSPGRVTWLGHATVAVELDGAVLVTDPVLRPRVMHLRRAWAADERVLQGLDAVLVSHVHFDHLDLPSLDRLGRDVHVIAPRGAGGLLRRRGFGRVTEVVEGDTVAVESVAVRVTHAEHRADRGPLGVKAPSVGFVVDGTRSVYFAGDTDLFDEMGEIAGLDLALLPISGWGARAGPGHLDPRRAAEALDRLRPRTCVPVHWDTYSPLAWSASRRAAARLAADEFRRLAAELAPGVRVEVLDRNGSLALT